MHLVVGPRLTDVRVVFNVLTHREHARPCCFRTSHKKCRTCCGREILRFGRKNVVFAVMSDNVRVQSATQWTASVHTLAHVQTCDNVRVQSATQWTASVHTLNFNTCPNLWLRSCSKCYAMDCFGTYFNTCPNLWLRSSCSKCYAMDCFGTYFNKCPNLWLRSCSKCYAMDCFGTYFNTCPNLWLRSCSKRYAMDCFGTYFNTCPNLWLRSCSKCYAMDIRWCVTVWKSCSFNGSGENMYCHALLKNF